METKRCRLVFSALCLALALGVSPVAAQPCEPESEKGKKKCNDTIDNDCDGFVDGEDQDCGGPSDPHGGDGSGSGSALRLIVTVPDLVDDNDNLQNLLNDDGGPYVDAEKVDAEATPEGSIRVSTQFRGKRGREIIVKGECVPVDFGGGIAEIDQCSVLLEVSPTWVVDETGSLTGRIGRLTVNPYVVNCLGPPVEQCRDVFTMDAGEDNAQLMGFRLLDGSSSNMEVASDIGGAFFEPGRCLSLLTAEQRKAFLDHNCTDPEDCNVTIEAFDTDPPDGVNDAWRIDTLALDEFGDPIGVTALICTSGRVLGQINLVLGLDFEVKP